MKVRVREAGGNPDLFNVFFQRQIKMADPLTAAVSTRSGADFRGKALRTNEKRFHSTLTLNGGHVLLTRSQ